MQAHFCGPIASLTLTPKLAVGKGVRDLNKASLIQDA